MELPDAEAKTPGQPWKRATAALTLENLPEECLFAILARLNATQLSQARLACKELAAVGKRPDLPPRQEQLQLALTTQANNRRLKWGVRQGQPAQRASWGQLLKQPGAHETLRHMPVLDLLMDGDIVTGYCHKVFRAVASCLEGGTALRTLRLENLQLLDDGAAALREELSAGVLRGLHHLELKEWTKGSFDVNDSLRAALRGLEGLRSLRFQVRRLRGPFLLTGARGFQDVQSDYGLSFYSSCEPEEGGGPGTGRTPPLTVWDLASFRSLELHGQGAPAAFHAVAEAGPRAFPGLTSLSIRDASCSDEDVAAIAQAPAAWALTSLHLGGPGVTLEAVKALARKDLGLEYAHLVAEEPEPPGEPEVLQGLTALSLEGCQFNREGAQALERHLELKVLQTLGLECCMYDEGGERGGWLACVKRWVAAAKGLTSLGLSTNQLEPVQLEEVLRDLADRRELSELSLRGNCWIEGSIIAPLARLSRLTALNLANTGVGDRGAAILASSAGLSSLQRLVLDWTNITLEGLKALTASPVLKELVDLSLAHCCLKDEGAALLAVAPNLGKLTRLCLRESGVGDKGALALSMSSTLRELAVLTLEDYHQTIAAGAKQLAFSTSLISLRTCTARLRPAITFKDEEAMEKWRRGWLESA